jgi:hypothetical protein
VAALIRMGKLCRHCTDKKCKDEGTDQEPIEIECPSCDGEGCDQCKQGSIEVKGCPNAYCSSVVQATVLADLFDKGLPPIQGGVLDQSLSFIEATRFLRGDEAQIRAEGSGD